MRSGAKRSGIKAANQGRDTYILIPYRSRAMLHHVKLVVRGLSGFEWDPGNWRKSELKHGVAAAEAEEVLLNHPVCQVDTRHSDDEQRYVALGVTNEGRRLFRGPHDPTEPGPDHLGAPDEPEGADGL
jgi:hypothetical protein